MTIHGHKSTLASSNPCQEGSHCKISSERNMGVVSTVNLCNKFFFLVQMHLSVKILSSTVNDMRS